MKKNTHTQNNTTAKQLNVSSLKRLIHFIKSQQDWSREKKQQQQITSVQNERKDNTTGPIAIKRKIKGYFKQLQSNKFNIGKMEVP